MPTPADPPQLLPASHPPRDGSTPAQLRRVTSIDLFGAGRALLIEHNGEVYALRVTSRGKLILTK